MALYGFGIGLCGSLMGVSGGAISTIVLTLYGKPIHNAIATSSGIAVPITIAGAIGFILAGLPHEAQLPPLSLGFVSLIGLRGDGAGRELCRALWRAVCAPAVAANARDRVRLFSLARVAALSVQLALKRARRIAFDRIMALRIAVQQQPVAAHLPALQPIEKAHAEQAGLELARLGHQSLNGVLDQTADGDAIERAPARRGCGR